MTNQRINTPAAHDFRADEQLTDDIRDVPLPRSISHSPMMSIEDREEERCAEPSCDIQAGLNEVRNRSPKTAVADQ